MERGSPSLFEDEVSQKCHKWKEDAERQGQEEGRGQELEAATGGVGRHLQG